MQERSSFLTCSAWILIFCLNASTVASPCSDLPGSQTLKPPSQATIQDRIQDSRFPNEHLAQNSSSISPYKIKRYVDEHRGDEYISLEEFWTRLGIPVEEWKKYGKCEVSLFELDLDCEAGLELLLRLYDDSGWSMGGTRYLIFKSGAIGHRTEWRLLGYVDLEDQRYSLPEHQVISSGKCHWLVLTALAGRGSGYGLYHDQWYEVIESGLREVLNYPSSKFLSWREPIPILETESKIIGAGAEPDKRRVRIELSASYVLYENGKADQRRVLWSKEQRVTFTRESGSREFTFNQQESDISQEEFDSVYDGEGPSNTEILKYNYADLKKIAVGKDERKREWLRLYLNECEETIEKVRLVKLLTT